MQTVSEMCRSSEGTQSFLSYVVVQSGKVVIVLFHKASIWRPTRMVVVMVATLVFVDVRLEHFDRNWKDDRAVLLSGYRVQRVQVSDRKGATHEK